MVENRATGSTKATQPKLGDYKQPEGAKKVMGNTVGSALRNPENSPNYLRKKGNKMKKLVLVVLVLGLLMSGCATMLTGTTQEVRVTAEPKDSKITIGGAIGQSPFSAQLEKGAAASRRHIITVEKDGYLPCKIGTTGAFNGWVIGNLLFFPLGTIIGTIVDMATGADTNIAERDISVVLYETKECDITINGKKGDAVYEKPEEVVVPKETTKAPENITGVQTGDPYRKK